jgi:two-component system, chemotaxis family, chemotaxis protein CheY
MNVERNDPVKVMIVDDSKMMRVMHARSLRQIGYEIDVVEAGSGEEALPLMSDDLDFAIVDWNMPGMDGIQLVEAVRAQEAATGKRRIPLMMITSQSTDEQAQLARAAGIDTVLTKPVTAEAIGIALDMLLARRG